MNGDDGVHITHCCVRYCAYGENETCPVATGRVEPQYQCENCTCLQMNPGADVKAEAWWQGLSKERKAELYLESREMRPY